MSYPASGIRSTRYSTPAALLVFLLVLCGLLASACADSTAGDDTPGDTQGDATHPGWLIGTWNYIHPTSDGGTSRDFTYHLNADGTFSKDEYYCGSTGSCDLRTGISTGQWTGDDSQITLGGQSYTHKATPNCKMIAIDGDLYLKNEDVSSCPFDLPPLSAADRCILGDFEHSAHNYTLTYTFNADRSYSLRRHVFGYIQSDSTTTTFGYWVIEKAYLVLTSPTQEEPIREALLVDPEASSSRLGDSSYQHRVEDQQCEVAALMQQCECASDSAATCMGASMLSACPDGCHRTATACDELCQDSGYESATGCRYSEQYKEDACFCDTGCECAEGDNQCNGNDLDYCQDGCSWSHLDCDDLCKEAGYDHSTSCGWDDDTDENVCWCE